MVQSLVMHFCTCGQKEKQWPKIFSRCKQEIVCRHGPGFIRCIQLGQWHVIISTCQFTVITHIPCMMSHGSGSLWFWTSYFARHGSKATHFISYIGEDFFSLVCFESEGPGHAHQIMPDIIKLMCISKVMGMQSHVDEWKVDYPFLLLESIR